MINLGRILKFWTRQIRPISNFFRAWTIVLRLKFLKKFEKLPSFKIFSIHVHGWKSGIRLVEIFAWKMYREEWSIRGGVRRHAERERLGKFRSKVSTWVWFYRRSRDDKVGANMEKATSRPTCPPLLSFFASADPGTDRFPVLRIEIFPRRGGGEGGGDILIYGQDRISLGRNNFDSRLCPANTHPNFE